jgi:hypothetical protein
MVPLSGVSLLAVAPFLGEAERAATLAGIGGGNLDAWNQDELRIS